MKQKTGFSTYDVYLVAVSFYSSQNSKLFKAILVTTEEECFALNQDPYFEISPEDQVAVSFICNSYLSIYRVCMRPHVVIDFSSYVGAPHNKEFLNGLFQLGSTQKERVFNITITGKNNLSSQAEDSKGSVTVLVDFTELRRNYMMKFIYFIGTLLVGMTLFFVFYFDNMLYNSTKGGVKAKKEDRRSKSSSISSMAST
jgi:hypothetical protein